MELKFEKLKITRFWTLFVSLLMTFIVTYGSYVKNNINDTDDDNLKFYAFLEFANQFVNPDSTQVDDDVMYIDVAYDKQLIGYADENGFPLGQIDITDRGKLVRLLQILRATDTYKFIFLDVRFEKGYESEYDDDLFSTIAEMPRIVVSAHQDIALADERIAPKTACSDYAASVVKTNFVRYEYLTDDVSTPLYMYREVTGNDMSGFWPLFYTRGGRLCENAPFIRFKSSFEGKFDADGNYKYYEMGVDLLDMMSEEEIGQLAANKYVVVSNMIDDVHDTYAGRQPGAFIVMTAFKALLNGDNCVGLWSTLIMAIIYFVITYRMMSGKNLLLFTRLKEKSKLLSTALSFVGYSIVLALCTIVLYLFGGMVYSIEIPSLLFSLMEVALPFVFDIPKEKE